ncbi:hypothetical protein Q0Y04_03225 [Clostridioides difficile]|nr:hypothetical protein Q0Y04_03225 [Clostridioides difficile]
MLLILGNLNLNLDFDYRIIREENDDVDIFIDINYRSLDIDTDGSNLFNSRIQFPFVRALILRLNKNNQCMTIHLLRDIDLFSAFANFEVDYTDSIVNIKNQNEKVILNKSIKNSKGALIGPNFFFSKLIIS